MLLLSYSPQLIELITSYNYKVTVPGSITRFALAFVAADNSHRINQILVEGSFQQFCIYPLPELDYMFFHVILYNILYALSYGMKAKGKKRVSLVCLRKYVLNQTIPVKYGCLCCFAGKHKVWLCLYSQCHHRQQSCALNISNTIKS